MNQTELLKLLIEYCPKTKINIGESTISSSPECRLVILPPTDTIVYSAVLCTDRPLQSFDDTNSQILWGIVDDNDHVHHVELLYSTAFSFTIPLQYHGQLYLLFQERRSQRPSHNHIIRKNFKSL